MVEDGYTELECWNGEEWSTTPIFKTSDSQDILDVHLSNGQLIQATPYHKWYVAVQDSRGRFIGETIKRTNELSTDDKLIKFNLEPCTHGNLYMRNAYSNGFHTADGTVHKSNSKPRIDLHGDKQSLLPYFSGYSSITETNGIIHVNYKKDVLQDKFIVPNSSHTVKSRLEWLAGYLDGDGTLTNNNGTESIQAASINYVFLNEVLLLLQELGIQGKVTLMSKAQFRSLPANDGTDRHLEYWCKDAYRLTIPGSELMKLLDIGFNAHRVQPTRRNYQREAKQFIKVVDVIDNNEACATYCGTEPLRNRLMFNGVLTGNCNEMSMSYDEVTGPGTGEIGLCNLASINLIKWSELTTFEAKRDFMYLLVKSADNAIENSFYANDSGQSHSNNHRNLGIGVSNYANWIATHRILWDSSEARRITHTLFEELSYFAITASIQLAKERSRCAVWKDTKWAKGLFPHEISILHNKESELNYPLLYDWDALRKELLQYGIRNSRILSIAPTATSGKCITATEGVDPIRKFKTIQEGTYSLPFIAPNLATNREYYQTTFNTDNKDVIELAAIRQKFICMSQSVSLAYAKPDSAYEILSDIMYAEELGLKGIYYTHTPVQGDLDEEGCGDACGS